MQKPLPLSPMPISQKMANRSTPSPQLVASGSHNNISRRPTTRITCRRKKRRISTRFRVVTELHDRTTTTATIPEATATAATTIAAASPRHFRRAARDRVRGHPLTKDQLKAKPTTTPRQRHRPRRSSILIASSMLLTRTLSSATALSARYMTEQPSAIRDDAARTDKGETAGGDAVNRRRPPRQQSQRFIVCTGSAEQTELAYGWRRLC